MSKHINRIKRINRINRREFIKGVGAMSAFSAFSSFSSAYSLAFAGANGMPKRRLGKTGQEVSIIGFGGIVVMGAEQSHANRVVREAFDRGMNYFDVAPSYGDAEERLGPALEGIRKDVFLACKTGKRTKAEAAAELRESLRRLKTDHIDLYQMHALTSIEETRQALSSGGAIEAFLEARDKGLVRFLGFSAHSEKAALEAMNLFDFDTILFPVNWVNYLNGNFGPKVIERAQSKGMGCLALKAMARTSWAKDEERNFKKCWYKPVINQSEANFALRFTLSEPIAAAIPPGEESLFKMALDIAERFRPLTAEDRLEIRRHIEGIEPLFKESA